MKNPRVLIYDLESCLNQAYLFGCGKQVVRHHQLIPGRSTWGIICITYCWNDGSPVKILKWTPEGGTKKIIEDFDKIIRQADFTIGKNSDRFDTKMINAQRMLADLPGLPEWTRYTDDLEKQIRKYFRLPSYSLDYISDQLGLGGKISMDFSDWVKIANYMEVCELRSANHNIKNQMDMCLDILCQHRYKSSMKEVLKKGKEAFDKMCFYGKKDTEDTRTLWNKLVKHFEPKFNMATYKEINIACKVCGSTHMKKNGTRISGKTKWQQYTCLDCHYTGNRTTLSKVSRKEGKIQ